MSLARPATVGRVQRIDAEHSDDGQSIANKILKSGGAGVIVHRNLSEKTAEEFQEYANRTVGRCVAVLCASVALFRSFKVL